MEPLVFISYRRKDSEDATARLQQGLVRRLGERRVFRDTSSIVYGGPFPESIKRALSGCKIMLVVIGEDWLCTRLNNERDWVRIEVEEALKSGSGIEVIPVRIHDAPMPLKEELPEPLRPLVERHGFEIHKDPAFDRDVEDLARKIAERVPGEKERFSIFLATDANDEQTESLHRRLTKRLKNEPGMKLLGDIPPPRSRAEHAREAIRLIEGADLCVHLLGREPGELIDGETKGTYVLEQARHALELGRPMLVLQPPDFELQAIKDEDYRRFFEQLNGSNEDRLELVRGQREELIGRVLARKSEILRSREGTPPRLTAAIDVDRADQGKAAPLVHYLQEHGVTPLVLPHADSSAPTPREIEKEFANVLEKSQLFIVIYGAAAYDWVRGRIKQATNIIFDEQFGTKVAVCLEPPMKSRERLKFSTMVINNLQRFDAATLDSLLRQAAGAS